MNYDEYSDDELLKLYNDLDTEIIEEMRAEFVYYNFKDVELVYRLDNKLKLFDLILSLAYLVKCNFKDVFGPVKMWDVFIYNHIDKKNIAVPPRSKRLTGEFQGAWVKDVIPGMYGWNMSFDFASLYPTIIRQWNLSPETIVEDVMADVSVSGMVSPGAKEEEWYDYAKENNYTIAANGAMFRKDKKGILPELMEFLMVGRKVAKKKMIGLEQEYQATKDKSLLPKISALNALQLALKVGANAGYGACTNSGFRYFDLRIGEAITLTGQASDQHAELCINGYFNKVLKTKDIDYGIAGDTDSLYLNVQPLVDLIAPGKSTDHVVKLLDKIGNEIQKGPIQSSINFIYDKGNCFEKLMDMKREAIASKAIFTAKKRYAMMVHNSEGVDYKPYKMKVVGLDIIKSSTPRAIRRELKDALPVIFEQGEVALREYVVKVKDRFMSLPIEDVSFPRSASDIDKWFDGKSYKKGTPIHVRGCILYNQYTKSMDKYDSLRNGDKVKFCRLVLPNSIRENVISFPSSGVLPPELGLHKYVDYELMFQKTFLDPLIGITEAIGWQLVERSSLESFFV
jgi:DNA polymerase elongation subunit (family B)